MIARRLTVVVCLLLVVGLLAPPASASTSWHVDSETVATGTSTGFSSEDAEDGISNVKTEAATGTDPHTELMLPFTDYSVNWDYVKYTTPPCPVGLPGNHSGALACPYPSGTLESDANTSYITASVGQADLTDLDRFHLVDPELPAGTVITKLTTFAWARVNDTPLADQFWVGVVGAESGTCWKKYQLTQAFVNYTQEWATSCDVSVDAWNLADLAALELHLYVVDVTPAGKKMTATYAGVVVTYSVPTDYKVDFTSNFVSVTGSNLRLAYMCTTTDAEEQLALTVAGSSSGTITCGGVATVKPVPGAAGQVAVRLQSVTVTGDATQSAYAFDSLYLLSDVDDQADGDKVRPPFDCSYDWFARSFVCRSTYAPPAGVEVVRISWALVRLADNVTVSEAEGLQVRLPTTSPFWDVGSDGYRVSVVVIHTYGVFARSGPVRDDDLPWLLLYVSLVVFALAVLYVVFGRGPTLKSFRKNHRLPRVPSLYRQRAVDVDEYPKGWISYRQYDPRMFKSYFSRRHEGKWVVYGVTKRGRILVQTVRVRKTGPET